MSELLSLMFQAGAGEIMPEAPFEMPSGYGPEIIELRNRRAIIQDVVQMEGREHRSWRLTAAGLQQVKQVCKLSCGAPVLAVRDDTAIEDLSDYGRFM